MPSVARYIEVSHSDTGEEKRPKNKNLAFMRVCRLFFPLSVYHHNTLCITMIHGFMYHYDTRGVSPWNPEKSFNQLSSRSQIRIQSLVSCPFRSPLCV